MTSLYSGIGWWAKVLGAYRRDSEVRELGQVKMR